MLASDYSTHPKGWFGANKNGEGKKMIGECKGRHRIRQERERETKSEAKHRAFLERFEEVEC